MKGGTGLSDGPFKLGMYLNELQMPFEAALDAAREIGAEYVWFDRLIGQPDLAAMSNERIDEIGEQVARRGLKLFMVAALNPFKKIHLSELNLDALSDHAEFRKDFDDLIRAMEIANRLDVGAVLAYTFAWPGEYTGEKPTWPMRWLTRGGVITEHDMDKLVKVFSLVLDQAEVHDVDVVLSMMPWNYTNTTGNFRLLAERLNSPRIKVMWGPADNMNCGERDVATSGLMNVRPYLSSLHLKDLHVIDGLRLNFEYRPIGEGDVDYPTLLRSLRDSRSDVVLASATHFLPESGSRVEAMQINYANLKSLIGNL